MNDLEELVERCRGVTIDHSLKRRRVQTVDEILQSFVVEPPLERAEA